MRNFAGTSITSTSTEQWLAYIKAGQAYTFGAQAGPVAAAISHVQLKNPAASGKTVIVRRAIATPGVSDQVHLNRFDTDLTIDAGAGINLLLGGAAGVAHVRTQTNAAEFGTVLYNISTLATTPLYIGPDWLCQLAPGQGILLDEVTVNNTFLASYFWVEL